MILWLDSLLFNLLKSFEHDKNDFASRKKMTKHNMYKSLPERKVGKRFSVLSLVFLSINFVEVRMYDSCGIVVGFVIEYNDMFF